MRAPGCLLAAAAFFLIGSLVPHLLPLGVTLGTDAERRYVVNAMESRAYINDKPVARLLSMLLVRRTVVRNLRVVPHSCSGGTDREIEYLTDTVADVIDLTFWGIPIEFYETSCAGLFITRGTITSSPQASGEPSGTIYPKPPPPPQPGHLPQPSPSN